MAETRRERKKRETRQRITTAAIRLFEEHGYEETTVAQIAAAADVDPKTFFNYFGSKDEVLFADMDSTYDLLLGAIAARPDAETPARTLARMIAEYGAHHLPERAPRSNAELSVAHRLVSTVPALRAKALYLEYESQQRVAEALCEAYGDGLDPIEAAAMTGAVFGALSQASVASIRLGRSQDEVWHDAERGVEIAMRGIRQHHGGTDE